MKTLIEEFNNMSSEPIFEIEHNGEYYIYYIQATDKGLEAGGCSNTGFGSMELEIVEWDNTFSLDEHLQELYDICLHDAIEE